MNADAFLAVATPAAFGGSALLGLLIGAFYGWYALGPQHPPVYPWALWAVGIAFIVMMVALGAGGETEPGTRVRYALEFGLARGVLWTTTCACLPIGRYVRYLVQLKLLQRKRTKLEKEGQ